MIIGLASPRVATSLDDALQRIDRLLGEAASKGGRIVCFPEAYLPGLRGQDFEPFPYDLRVQREAVEAVSQLAAKHGVATIMGMELLTDGEKQIAAVVFDRNGEVLGQQTKNQLDPSEDRFYAPGDTRRLFEVDGVKFGIVICHEGFRYPETVRWAAVRGAKIVFHPHLAGSDREGVTRKEWGERGAPYYEQAMAMRSRENTIYFASANCAFRFAESASSVITPNGDCQAHLAYGEEGVLAADVDLDDATGLLATRYAPERHQG